MGGFPEGAQCVFWVPVLLGPGPMFPIGSQWGLMNPITTPNSWKPVHYSMRPPLQMFNKKWFPRSADHLQFQHLAVWQKLNKTNSGNGNNHIRRKRTTQRGGKQEAWFNLISQVLISYLLIILIMLLLHCPSWRCYLVISPSLISQLCLKVCRSIHLVSSSVCWLIVISTLLFSHGVFSHLNVCDSQGPFHWVWCCSKW